MGKFKCCVGGEILFGSQVADNQLLFIFLKCSLNQLKPKQNQFIHFFPPLRTPPLPLATANLYILEQLDLQQN